MYPTESVSILGHGVDFLVSEDLDVFSTCPAVELVGPNKSPADPVRHFTLLAHMLRKIRRRLNSYL